MVWLIRETGEFRWNWRMGDILKETIAPGFFRSIVSIEVNHNWR